MHVCVYMQRTFLFTFSTGLAIQRSEATTCSPVLYTSALLQALQELFHSAQRWWLSRQRREIKHKQSVKYCTDWILDQKNPKVLVLTLKWAGPLTSATTAFPQLVQHLKLQINLTGTLGDPGMLILSSSYVNLPGVNLSLSRMKPVRWHCQQSYLSKVNSVTCTS